MTVTGLRSNDGVVCCALHNSPAAFPKAGQEWRGVIAPIRDRQATYNASGSFGPPDFNAAAFRYDGGNLALQASLTY